MSFLLPKLSSKKAVDQAIKSTAEKVLVLRFGRDNDPVCLQLDDIVSEFFKIFIKNLYVLTPNICRLHEREQAGPRDPAVQLLAHFHQELIMCLPEPNRLGCDCVESALAVLPQ